MSDNRVSIIKTAPFGSFKREDSKKPLNASSSALGFVFSVLVGLVFGLYPARKAAHMDPIEALRYE